MMPIGEKGPEENTVSAGTLYIPESLGYSASIKDADEFEKELIRAMTEPIIEPHTAGAMLPFIVRTSSKTEGVEANEYVRRSIQSALRRQGIKPIAE